jgi:hypothetical protein
MFRIQTHSMVLIALVLAVAPVAASVPGGNPAAFSGVATEPSVGLINSGLIDLSRLEVNHSLSFGYTSSSAFGSQSGGLWNTRFGYRLAGPLKITMDVGATLDPAGDALLNEKSFFLGGFNLDYRPSDRFQLNISYVNTPRAAYPALGYRPGAYREPWEPFPSSTR